MAAGKLLMQHHRKLLMDFISVDLLRLKLFGEVITTSPEKYFPMLPIFFFVRNEQVKLVLTTTLDSCCPQWMLTSWNGRKMLAAQWDIKEFFAIHTSKHSCTLEVYIINGWIAFSSVSEKWFWLSDPGYSIPTGTRIVKISLAFTSTRKVLRRNVCLSIMLFEIPEVLRSEMTEKNKIEKAHSYYDFF